MKKTKKKKKQILWPTIIFTKII